ncbi:MAG: endo-1,4-beta-xylanase [Prevotella sp.]|nr:endo-1,4-beta-xylanase [Prevotella sp.]
MNQFCKKTLICLFGAGLITTQASAQLSSNPDKFLGNITTRYQMDAGGGVQKYYELWNQVTPENESKWGSVEGTKGSYNWGCDTPFNYAKNHNFTYKFHALVWGAQYPNWFSTSMSIKDRYNAITTWFDAVKKKYKTLPMIDVVNEAVGTHQPGNPMMKESLGGGGKTGYDWLIKAFELAYERWPDAILIYNDYNTFQWNTDEYIDLVRYLRDSGAPIDAYGCQSHDLTDCDVNKFKTADKKIQDALRMPMYSTEYDIGTSDDALQLKRYKEQIPYMWENDYCAGITLWGYIYGATWTTDGNSGIIKNGKDRPAMTWLREYMATDAAKNAKSPFPGMKKEASIYIRPRDLKVAKGDVLPIKVRASMATKTIQKIDLYVGEKENNMELMTTLTEAPYVTEYAVPTDAKNGWKFLKAVVTTTDGSTYERYGRFNVLSSTTKRAPYNETVPTLPGTIKAEEYDNGASGVSYSNASRNTTTATKANAWMEYTVDVAEKALYSMDVEIASTQTGGTFHLAEYSLDNLTYLTDFIEVPKTGSTTDFQTMHVVLKDTLTAGRHILCVNIDKGGFYLKSMTFNRCEQDKNIKVSIPSSSYFNPSSRSNTIELGDKAIIEVKAESSTSTIDHVNVYANDLLIGTMKEAPYTMEYEPTAKGSYVITAIATSTEGKENISSKKKLTVNGKREPYKGVIEIPGIIQAENFDKGGEGMTFHDSDSNREGDTNYRTDGEGIDFVKGNGGTCIGYTAANEWLEYTINVKEAGKYAYIATVSSGTTGSGFKINLVKNGRVTTPILATINVPQTGNNNWDTYTTVEGEFSKELEAGEQILRFTITGANCNIDKVELKCLTAGIHDMLYDVPVTNQNSYDLFGRKVDNNYKGIIIRNGKKYINK